MANDPDALFPSGPTTRRGLLTASPGGARRCPCRGGRARARTGGGATTFDEEPPEWVEPMLSRRRADRRDPRRRRTTPGSTSGGSGRAASSCASRASDSPARPVSLRHDDPVSTRERHALRADQRACRRAPSCSRSSTSSSTSHAHLDHLDPGTLPHVLSGDATFVCAAGSEEHRNRARRPQARRRDRRRRRRELRRLPGLAVPAYHEGAPEAIGYVMRNGAYSLYHAGDTRRVQGMAEAVHRTASTSRSYRSTAPPAATTDGADAARLAYETAAPIAIPCHYEMFRYDTSSPSRFVAECVRLGAGVPPAPRRRADHDRLRLLASSRPPTRETPSGQGQRAIQPLSSTTGVPVKARPPVPSRNAATSATSDGLDQLA